MGSSACRLAAAFLAALMAGAAQADERPNLLVILVDDLRWDMLGHAGHPFAETPNIDRLAAEGTRFEDAFVITSVCSPSRATYLTGLYTHEHGVRSIWHTLDPELPTVPRLLRAEGYDTGWVGKWHLSKADEPWPDFDHWVSFVAQGSYAHPTLNVDGERLPHQGHMTAILTQYALDYLERPRERPFYLTLSHLAVHTPYLPQLHLKDYYGGRKVEEPRSAREDRAQKPAFLECRRAGDSMAKATREYLGLLKGVDEGIGRILDHLETTGELDRTLILFTSDNGYLLGEHLLTDKRVAYEESMRIPLIARYPRWFAAGATAGGTLALNLDWAATLLDAAGVAKPAAMRGISLRQQATGRRVRDEFLYVYYREINANSERAECTPNIASLRTLDEKLILYPGAGELAELYALKADPHEMHNLAVMGEASARVDELSARLSALADSLGSDILGN